jgi:hypothetical protein
VRAPRHREQLRCCHLLDIPRHCAIVMLVRALANVYALQRLETSAKRIVSPSTWNRPVGSDPVAPFDCHHLRCRPAELRIQMVACPRNQHDVVSVRRFLIFPTPERRKRPVLLRCACASLQHRSRIALSLDSERAFIRVGTIASIRGRSRTAPAVQRDGVLDYRYRCADHPRSRRHWNRSTLSMLGAMMAPRGCFEPRAGLMRLQAR